MDTADLNSPRSQEYEPGGSPAPGALEKIKDGSDPVKLTKKGVENAKKKLRAFSIQKKPALTPVPQPKPLSCGSNTVFIGKFTSSKPPLKPGGIEEVVDPKKPPKPPKPGTVKYQNADYLNLQKKTLSEIEDMKRKMELVELGIPLGLICPASDSDKAMPTKAMPPIKSLLDPAKVDEIIREAKKAKAEGKSFKFSYQKQLPSYENPFKKKEQPHALVEDPRLRNRRRFNETRRYSVHKDRSKDRDYYRDDKHRDKREKGDRSKHRDDRKDKRSKERDAKSRDRDSKKDTINLTDDDDDIHEVLDEVAEKDEKETDVNLKGFVVCDSWSENEDKNKETSPKSEDKNIKEEMNESSKEDRKDLTTSPVLDPMEQLKQSLLKSAEVPIESIEKLKPVTDSFKFEIEDDDDEALDMFSENTALNKFAKQIPKKASTSSMRFDYESKDSPMDVMDDTFLESVIAEIKQEKIDDDDDTIQDKGLVEYDFSPKEDERESVTPELDNRTRELYSSRSDYSDGFKSVESVKSTESGYKSTETGYKFSECGYKSTERGYKSTERGYKSTERGYKSSERGYKSTERGYKSTESGYKSTESGYKSPCSTYKSDRDNKSVESGYKSTESGYKSTECGYKSPEISKPMDLHPEVEPKLAKSTMDSLETWSFVLKICQPLLFRHDNKRCYKETRVSPKLWYAANPKACACVKDRGIVYDELEMCKTELVDAVYGTARVQEAIYPEARGWYPATFLSESAPHTVCSEWEADDSQERPTPPPHAIRLDREYQKFMEAVWPDVEGNKSETPRSTPVREAGKKKAEDEPDIKKKKMRLSSEGWSQESDVDEEIEKTKKRKVDKMKRKRKLSTSLSESDSVTPSKKKKTQKKDKQKSKSKSTKRRLSKKFLKKLKDKQLKKKRKLAKIEEVQDREKEKKKKDKKVKKKKLLKQKKKTPKKKKTKAKSSSSSDSEPERSKKSDNKKKKRKQSTSESNHSEELFDVNILKNIKTERLTDDEKSKLSPVKKHREIIDVKELQNDFVSIQIKKEIEDVNSPEAFDEIDSYTEEEMRVIAQIEQKKKELEDCDEGDEERIKADSEAKEVADTEIKIVEEKMEEESKEPEPEYVRPLTPQIKLPDENLSQCSSQESIVSAKEQPYEKDDSHLRPSSQNSNYTFHDVMQNSGHEMPPQSELYTKDIQMEMDPEYEQGNYEMYEQMAMEYQSDVASQRAAPPESVPSGRIETVVRTHSRGEIKCDWRAGDPSGAAARPAPRRDPSQAPRVSRWGLKPGDVNIVLTGGNETESPQKSEQTAQYSSPSLSPASGPAPAPAPAVYQIQSIANRTENSNSGYDEAYMDMYGASDRLQYGDCFARESACRAAETQPPAHSSTLDDRIDLALRTTVLGEVAKTDTETDDGPDKGILVTKSLAEGRSAKRVSFADGYKPGQDSDTEEPPVRKKKKVRRVGCEWPCPATHPDHVSLWDALPPPPPPAGSPPPPRAPAPPLHLLRQQRRQPSMLSQTLPHPMPKFDPNSLTGFMPPEPPPGLISF